jgi:hypothetical protein
LIILIRVVMGMTIIIGQVTVPGIMVVTPKRPADPGIIVEFLSECGAFRANDPLVRIDGVFPADGPAAGLAVGNLQISAVP